MTPVPAVDEIVPANELKDEVCDELESAVVEELSLVLDPTTDVVAVPVPDEATLLIVVCIALEGDAAD